MSTPKPIPRTIIVQEIPPNTTSDELTIYFQRRKNGGDDVERVVFPFQNKNTALVTFEDEQTVKSVTSKEHLIKSKEVHVEPFFPQIFSRVTVLISPEVFSSFISFKEALHSLQDMSNLEIVVNEGQNKIVATGCWQEVQKLHEYLFDRMAKCERHEEMKMAETITDGANCDLPQSDDEVNEHDSLSGTSPGAVRLQEQRLKETNAESACFFNETEKEDANQVTDESMVDKLHTQLQELSPESISSDLSEGVRQISQPRSTDLLTDVNLKDQSTSSDVSPSNNHESHSKSLDFSAAVEYSSQSKSSNLSSDHADVNQMDPSRSSDLSTGSKHMSQLKSPDSSTTVSTVNQSSHSGVSQKNQSVPNDLSADQENQSTSDVSQVNQSESELVSGLNDTYSLPGSSALSMVQNEDSPNSTQERIDPNQGNRKTFLQVSDQLVNINHDENLARKVTSGVGNQNIHTTTMPGQVEDMEYEESPSSEVNNQYRADSAAPSHREPDEQVMHPTVSTTTRIRHNNSMENTVNHTTYPGVSESIRKETSTSDHTETSSGAAGGQLYSDAVKSKSYAASTQTYSGHMDMKESHSHQYEQPKKKNHESAFSQNSSSTRGFNVTPESPSIGESDSHRGKTFHTGEYETTVKAGNLGETEKIIYTTRISVYKKIYDVMLRYFFSSFTELSEKFQDVKMDRDLVDSNEGFITFTSKNESSMESFVSGIAELYYEAAIGFSKITTIYLALPSQVQRNELKEVLSKRTDRGACLQIKDDKIKIEGFEKIVRQEKNYLSKLWNIGRGRGISRRFDRNTEPSSAAGQTSSIQSSKFHTNEGLRVLVYQNDITTVQVDVIVNAANEELLHGGGVAAAIAKAAGPKFLEECQRYIKKNGRLNVGDVMRCNSYRLSNVIQIYNTVGPRWSSKSQDTFKTSLLSAYRNCLSEADRGKQRSIAIPLVSSGIFGGKKDICAEMLWKAVNGFSKKCGKITSVKEIHLVNIDKETTGIITAVFERNFSKTAAVSYPDKSFPSPGAGANISTNSRVEYPTGTYDQYSQGSKQTHGPSSSTHGYRETGVGTDRSNHSTTNSHVKYPTDTYDQYSQGSKQTDVPSSSTYGYRETGVGTDRSNHSTTEQFGAVSSESRGKHGADGRQRSRNWQKNDNEADGFSKKPNYHMSNVATEEEKKPSVSDEENTKKDDLCAICLDEIEEEKILKCGHKYCKKCIDQYGKPKCPVCGKVFDIMHGTMPYGTMYDYIDHYNRLPGYESTRTIVINYYFQGGTQGIDHPNPGKHYTGTHRRAYLPDTSEGRKVLRLLKKAFASRLTFTIGTSRTTGATDTVTWNDIHHKTSVIGGPESFGYPDPTYLQRVQEELAAHGITE